MTIRDTLIALAAGFLMACGPASPEGSGIDATETDTQVAPDTNPVAPDADPGATDTGEPRQTVHCDMRLYDDVCVERDLRAEEVQGYEEQCLLYFSKYGVGGCPSGAVGVCTLDEILGGGGSVDFGPRLQQPEHSVAVPGRGRALRGRHHLV